MSNSPAEAFGGEQKRMRTLEYVLDGVLVPVETFRQRLDGPNKDNFGVAFPDAPYRRARCMRRDNDGFDSGPVLDGRRVRMCGASKRQQRRQDEAHHHQ